MRNSEPVDAAAVDEDTFVIPAVWHRHRHARRGSSGVTPFIPRNDARASVDQLIDEWSGDVVRVLEAPTTDGAVTRAGLAWLAGDPAAPPVGAAAVVIAEPGGYYIDQVITFADVWIVERGLRFAAQAAVELVSLVATDHSAALPGNGPPRKRTKNPGVRRRRPGESGYDWNMISLIMVVLRVRGALAAASDTEYGDVLDALTPYRSAGGHSRAATSALFPARQDWVEQDIAEAIADGDRGRAKLLLVAAGSGAQVHALAAVHRTYDWLVESLALMTTIVDGVGVEAAPMLFDLFDAQPVGSALSRRVLSVLSWLPSDEVMRWFLHRLKVKDVVPALLEAAERYPVRATRVLAEDAGSVAVAALLRAHVFAHPEAAVRAVGALDPDSARRVEAIRAAAAAIVWAPLSAVPSLLVDPPWQGRERSAPPVVAGLSCADPASISWEDGEREAWRKQATPSGGEHSWTEIAARIADGSERSFDLARFVGEAPEELVLPLLATWRPRDPWQSGEWMRILVARFELQALPVVFDVARRSAVEAAETLMPFGGPVIAELMADWFARVKTVRDTALRWLLRHPADAGRALVPRALGKAGLRRRQAEQALLALQANGGGDAVRAAAQDYGPAAAAGIEALLAVDPLLATMPALPGWAAPGELPPVRLRDGSGALPAEAVTNLVTVLALSRLDAPYAGVDVVKQACDSADLAELGWDLFQRWTAHGSNVKESWALDALGLIGDDETVRRLTPFILAWPGQSCHARALTGVQVLATIGTDMALMHLHGITEKSKFRGLKAAARQRMDAAAAARGLNADQLADRVVPDFGLAADGSLSLDYGPRQFVVGFDEQLRPYVSDGAGARLKALPKPGVRDDAELAGAAYQRFAVLKKDVRAVAAGQIRRLEQAMVTGRRWTGAELREVFVAHPLLWHIVRRLVWGLYGDDGKPVGAVRIAEDRTFATVDDDETKLPDDARVGVAHPLHLAGALPGWVEVFADYGILQPFAQLSRQTFTLTEDETADGRLTRFHGLTVPTGKVVGLQRRGWWCEAQEGGIRQRSVAYKVGPEQMVTVDLSPGINTADRSATPEQRLDAVYLHDGTADGWKAAHGLTPIGALDPGVVSEIIRDLTELTL